MLAPGVPTTVAEAIVRHPDDPAAMGKAIVHATMSHRYLSPAGAYAPAAAFDVIDCDPAKVGTMRSAIRTLDGAVAKAARADDGVREAVLDDASGVDGMVRFDQGHLPWHADRPAIELYDTLAADERLPANVRRDAAKASAAVGDTIVAHAEKGAFAPFGAGLSRRRGTDGPLRNDGRRTRSVGACGQRDPHDVLQRGRRRSRRSGALGVSHPVSV